MQENSDTRNKKQRQHKQVRTLARVRRTSDPKLRTQIKYNNNGGETVAGPLCSLPRTYGDCRVPYGPMVFKKKFTCSGVGTPFHVLTKKAEHQRATSC